MSYVAINVLTVPKGAGATLEERFAARQGAVDSAPGFEHFELLRPVAGTSDYLVYTRWRSEADFTAWRESQAFGQGHAQASGRPEGAPPAATGSRIWAFAVAQSSDGTDPDPDEGREPGARHRDGTHADPGQAREPVSQVVTTDPGPRQQPGQGQDTPSQDQGEPGFA